MEFTNLFKPIKIGCVKVKNRIVFPPIDVALHHPEKAVDERYVDFLSRLAAGGTGMIITEFTAVETEDFWVSASRIDSDSYITDYQYMTEKVHMAGAKIFMQLALLGGRAPTGRAIAPSAIESPLYPRIPEELEKREIKELVEKWIDAAIRAKKAGFDGVEIHGGHTYLIGAFMSPHANRRVDEYGYDFNGRMRFPEQIVRGIKDACGINFPVGFKFSAYEALENGIRGHLAVDIARHLEHAGVDYLHLSSSTYLLAGTRYPDVPPMYCKEGPLVNFAQLIKKKARVPVIVVAGITSPEFAESVISEGKADMVAVGRAMFADAQWSLKAKKCRPEDITPCIRCNVCHKTVVIDRAGSVVCTTNPELSHAPAEPVVVKKKIAVVGAGPAGIKAALTAAKRGHEVVLFEKSKRIGGNMNLAAYPQFKNTLYKYIKYLERRLDESSVVCHLNREVTVEQIEAEEIDTVIAATGSTPVIPDIPGLKDVPIFLPEDVFQEDHQEDEIGMRVAVIGAGRIGCELAWHLSLEGKKVYLIDILDAGKLLSEEHPTNRSILLEGLEESSVTLLDKSTISRVEKDHLRLVRDGNEISLMIDSITLAAGRRPARELADSLSSISHLKVYNIGDSTGVGDIYCSVRDGFQAGRDV